MQSVKSTPAKRINGNFIQFQKLVFFRPEIHLLLAFLTGNMPRQLVTNAAMQHVRKLIQDLQNEGHTPEQLVEALKARGFEIREATEQQDWELKAPGMSDWLKGVDLARDGSLTWIEIEKAHAKQVQQKASVDQQSQSSAAAPADVQGALAALVDLMQSMLVAVQNMVSKIINAILRACGINHQIALMPGGKPTALQVKSDQVDTADAQGAVKAINDMSTALKTNDADLVPPAPSGEPEAAQARAELTQNLAFASLRLTPDELVGIARRTAVQASGVARPSEQQAAIAAAAQNIARQAKQYKFDPAEVHEKLRQLQVVGAQQIQRVADHHQDKPLNLHARAMTIVAQDRAEMTNRGLEMSMQ